MRKARSAVRASRPLSERKLRQIVATYLSRCDGYDKRRVVTNHDARLQWAGGEHGIAFSRLMRHELRLREMIAEHFGWDANVFQENVVRAQTITAARPRRRLTA